VPTSGRSACRCRPCWPTSPSRWSTGCSQWIRSRSVFGAPRGPEAPLFGSRIALVWLPLHCRQLRPRVEH
jgi:hypothetical protein